MKKLTWFLCFLLFAVSCLDEPECYLLNNNVVGIYFRVMGSNRVDSLAVRKFLINGLPVQSTRGGIWDRSTDSIVTNAQVPLDFFNTQTTYTIGTHRDGTALDRSMTLDYKVQAQYVSEECGPRYILSDLAVIDSEFDSVRVVNTEPSRDGSSRHVEIYRCPATDTLMLTLNQLTLPSATSNTNSNRSRPASSTLNGVLVEGSEPLYPGETKTTIRLPVNLNANSTSYSFDLASGSGGSQVQTLTVGYETTTEVRYRQCGSQTFVSGLQIEGSNFDSVSLARDPNGFPYSTLTDPAQNNVNIYRCPTTNLLQISFRRAVPGSTTPQTATANIGSITTSYTPEVFYENESRSVIQLPLNLNANSTEFTITIDGTPQTLTVNYVTGPPPVALFRNACSGIKTVSGITVAWTGGPTTVPNAATAFPPVNNVTLEIP